mmetsp:Transcript_15882/g.38440  ORF Transcript_15882/g.38440 Transcript_15882/m.38440 type:complete len:206 (-) Transcript_15882:28-645(-)
MAMHACGPALNSECPRTTHAAEKPGDRRRAWSSTASRLPTSPNPSRRTLTATRWLVSSSSHSTVCAKVPIPSSLTTLYLPPSTTGRCAPTPWDAAAGRTRNPAWSCISPSPPSSCCPSSSDAHRCISLSSPHVSRFVSDRGRPRDEAEGSEGSRGKDPGRLKAEKAEPSPPGPQKVPSPRGRPFAAIHQHLPPPHRQASSLRPAA